MQKKVLRADSVSRKAAVAIQRRSTGRSTTGEPLQRDAKSSLGDAYISLETRISR
jgi:hypothetical protein